jgi:putative copper export protein
VEGAATPYGAALAAKLALLPAVLLTAWAARRAAADRRPHWWRLEVALLVGLLALAGLLASLPPQTP